MTPIQETPRDGPIDQYLPIFGEGLIHATSMYSCSSSEREDIYGLFYSFGEIDKTKVANTLAFQPFRNQKGDLDYETHGATYIEFTGNLNMARIVINSLHNNDRENMNLTLFHEIDHLVFYILTYLRNKDRFIETFSQSHPYYGSVLRFKTEALARINSGNAAIRNDQAWPNIFMIGGREALLVNDQGYRKACEVSVNILESRNRIYNLCIQRWGLNEKGYDNFNIKEPGMRIFDIFCKGINDYLFHAQGVDEAIEFAVFIRWMSFQPDIKTAFNLVFNNLNVHQSPELGRVYNNPNLRKFQESNIIAKTILQIN